VLTVDITSPSVSDGKQIIFKLGDCGVILFAVTCAVAVPH
jgi:hypothetical protein